MSSHYNASLSCTNHKPACCTTQRTCNHCWHEDEKKKKKKFFCVCVCVCCCCCFFFLLDSDRIHGGIYRRTNKWRVYNSAVKANTAVTARATKRMTARKQEGSSSLGKRDIVRIFCIPALQRTARKTGTTTQSIDTVKQPNPSNTRYFFLHRQDREDGHKLHVKVRAKLQT